MGFQTLIGALIEAWGEVKVQKARVILSLVGVVAAVAAMTTVIAIGQMGMQGAKEMMEASSGRDVTLTLTPTKKESTGTKDATDGGGDTGFSDSTLSMDGSNTGADAAPAADDAEAGWSAEATGITNTPVTAAMHTIADRFKIPYWSRMTGGKAKLEEYTEMKNAGTFHGAPIPPVNPDIGEYEDPSVTAVDPAYETIFRKKPMQGRWLRSGDVNQRVVPIVINENLWKSFGSPNIFRPTVITMQGQTPTQMKIVGVVPSDSSWETPTIFMPFDAWEMTKTPEEAAQTQAAMLVWVSPDQAEQARKVLPEAMESILGPSEWNVTATGGISETGTDMLQTAQMVIMLIGGIVILLGALGLLNVAIVTVRQRIREIGIRRALGASASRVFFAVFLESVVATFVAGVLGVGLAIVATRLIPLESLGLVLQETPPFPVGAAVIGVAIATGIGALCGIIPAFAAIRVKPIDAIRY